MGEELFLNNDYILMGCKRFIRHSGPIENHFFSPGNWEKK